MSAAMDGASPSAASERPAPPVLEARNLSAGYGAQPVVHDVNLEVRAGEVVALLGRNGAGKTTTLLALSGELPLLGGEVRLGGRVTKAPLYRRARAGLGFVTEERSVFKTMSAGDNLRVGDSDAEAALALFPELGKRLSVSGGLLSGGEQQMLTLARALSRKPQLLLADELSLGLAPLIVKRLLEAVRSAADGRGTGVLLVEQHVRKALLYVDRAYVMRRGRIVMAGEARDLRGRVDEIEQTYFTAGDEPDTNPTKERSPHAT